MMITLLSKIKQWLLNYRILIIPSYQSGPGPVLPARIVLYAGCNHYFFEDKEVAKYLTAVIVEVNPNYTSIGIYCSHRVRLNY